MILTDKILGARIRGHTRTTRPGSTSLAPFAGLLTENARIGARFIADRLSAHTLGSIPKGEGAVVRYRTEPARCPP